MKVQIFNLLIHSANLFLVGICSAHALGYKSVYYILTLTVLVLVFEVLFTNTEVSLVLLIKDIFMA